MADQWDVVSQTSTNTPPPPTTPPAQQNDPWAVVGQSPSSPAPQSTAAQPGIWDQLKTYDPNIGIISGALKEAQKHVAGAIDLVNKYIIAPNDPGATATTQKVSQAAQATADWLRKNTSEDTFLEHAGGDAESAAELLLPETWGGKAVEGMSYADRLLAMGRNAKILEKAPGLIPLLQAGLKNSAMMGAQKFVESGGDPQAAEAGLVTGGAGTLALGGLGLAAGGVASRLLGGAEDAIPEAADIGGVKIPRVAEGAPGVAQAAQSEAQHAGLQQSFGNVVNNAVRRTLAPYDIDPLPANHFGDASAQIGKAAVTDFDELIGRAENLHGEDVGAQVRDLNQAVNDAPLSGRASAKQALFNFLDSIDDPRYPDSLRDVAIRARNTYEKKFMADDLHSMLGKYFNYASPETAEMMGEPYSLDLAGQGDNMKAALRKFEEDYGRDAVTNFLGKDGFRNLHQMADVASDPVYNENANGILRQVLQGAHEGQKGNWVPSSVLSGFAQLPFMKTLGTLKAIGAVRGGIEAALPMLKYQIATNPRVGGLLTFAAKNGLSARYVAPFINAAIYGELNPPPAQQGAK